MVKKMDDYANRMSDRRFEKFDKMIIPNNNDKKLSIILTIGLVISLLYLGSSLMTQSQAPAALKYEQGLNISYSPESSTYFIDYTNPKNDTTSMTIDVQIPRNDISYISTFSTEIKKFPANISYKPSNIDAFNDICKSIENTVKMALPKKELILCVDGSAPISKQNQQRQRRFKSSKEASSKEEFSKELSLKEENEETDGESISSYNSSKQEIKYIRPYNKIDINLLIDDVIDH